MNMYYIQIIIYLKNKIRMEYITPLSNKKYNLNDLTITLPTQISKKFSKYNLHFTIIPYTKNKKAHFVDMEHYNEKYKNKYLPIDIIEYCITNMSEYKMYKKRKHWYNTIKIKGE